MTELKIKTEKEPLIQKKLSVIPSKEISDKKDSGSIGKFYATGKRKNAIARVWIKAGKGKITVNEKNIDQYFTSNTHVKTILQPFILTKTSGQYDVICTVKGGGISGQKGAILHGIAKALDISAPEFHPLLRKGGFLTRDSRVVERKKYGQRKARKKTQFSKR
ncbi:30S ribosomal protein S9 [Rickettsia endosymbiont of Halotydeus destructor]|uniref:30S ribosomal protein S9 n=1 Tax=Rickettsia endosymbiont of Halotydeus destructor TaxID=2996754 RepID=UPI003BAE99BC